MTKKRITDFSELCEEWSELNELKIETVTYRYSTKVFWSCRKCGDVWRCSPKDRLFNNVTCTRCSQTFKTVKDYPLIMKDWSWELNKIPPELYSRSSKSIVEWICHSCLNRWQASVANRCNKNNGCPECAKKSHKTTQNLKSLERNGSLFKNSKSLIKEWDYEKNTINPKDISCTSSLKVWWVCEENHSWAAKIGVRYNRGSKCPQCAAIESINKTNLNRALSGESFNDVANDLLISEWDTSKNLLKINEVLPNSHAKVWWRCSKDHSWLATPSSRINGSDCPYCSMSTKRSKGEVELSAFIKSQGLQILENNRSLIKPFEIDIYISSLNIALEYNGDYWHSDEVILSKTGLTSDKYHLNKYELCKDKGIQLLYIWESDWLNNKDSVKLSILKALKTSTIDSILLKFTND